MADRITERGLMLRIRKGNLTNEQFKVYSAVYESMTLQAEAVTGGRLSKRTLELVEDRALTWAETGVDPATLIQGRGPADFDADVEAAEIESEVQRLRFREAAARKVKAENSAGLELPRPVPLDVLLETPDQAAAYRIHGLLPAGGNVILGAQYKAGKTTLTGNLTRSLVDGTPFLDRFPVEQTRASISNDRGGVLIFDNELNESQSRHWFREQGITNTDAVEIVHLRGKLSTFDILDPATRAAWARRIEGADVVILDCLRPVLDALGLSEDKDAGKFLVAWDALLTEASVKESVVVHHMGHSGERSRGDSRILDWPDATWKIVREDADDPTSARYFSAFGRDVDVAESRLNYDPATRHLTLAGGSRKEARTDAVMPALVQLLTENDALSGREVEKRLTEQGHPQKAIRAALLKAHRQGRTFTYEGPRRATMHSLNAKYGVPPATPTAGADPSAASPFAIFQLSASSASPVRQHTQVECVSASIEDALHSLDTEPTASANTLTHSNGRTPKQ